MHRFFVPKEQISNDQITITGSDVNHIKNVLRLKIGDKIEVFDSSQNTYQCEIKSFNRAVPAGRQEFILGSILSMKKQDVESNIKMTLAQCLAKGKKMDLIIKMATELGVNSIIPVISERSVPKIDEKEEKKIAHWQAIAKEASEQSGRTKIPRIENITSISELNPKDYDLALMPWEGEKIDSFKKALSKWNRDVQSQVPLPNNILIIVGPEGGFSHAEAEKAKEAGFKSVSLGKRILRCETAAVSTLANIFYELEN